MLKRDKFDFRGNFMCINSEGLLKKTNVATVKKKSWTFGFIGWSIITHKGTCCGTGCGDKTLVRKLQPRSQCVSFCEVT